MIVSRVVRSAVIVAFAMLPAATSLAANTTSDKGYTVDPCYKQCSPLLASVTPKQEAQRVFKNCFAYCSHKGVITCPNGVTVTPNGVCR